jgi:hypothetical protein
MNNLQYDITDPSEFIRGKKAAKYQLPAETGATDDYMHGYDMQLTGPSLLADTESDNRVSLFA